MIQLTTWQVITLVVVIVGAIGGFGRVLLAQIERRLVDKFEQQDRRLTELEAEVRRQGSELPLHYVRREDWIRFSAAIDHKLDRLAELVIGKMAGGTRARD